MSDKRKIRILILEDEPNDVDLIRRTLDDLDVELDLRIVIQEYDFVHFLTHFNPEIILSDYRLPDFSGLYALDYALKICPEAIFIFVTGAVGEEIAADTVLAGASGFVLKSNLPRLIPVIKSSWKKKDKKEIESTIDLVEDISQRISAQISANNKVLNRAQKYLSEFKGSSEIYFDLKQQLDDSNKKLIELSSQDVIREARIENKNKVE